MATNSGIKKEKISGKRMILQDKIPGTVSRRRFVVGAVINLNKSSVLSIGKLQMISRITYLLFVS